MHGKWFSRWQRSYQNCGLCWLSWISNLMRFRITWSYGRAWGGLSWEDYWRWNDPPIVSDTIPWVDLLEYTKRRKWVTHRHSCSLFLEVTKPFPLNSASRTLHHNGQSSPMSANTLLPSGAFITATRKITNTRTFSETKYPPLSCNRNLLLVIVRIYIIRKYHWGCFV